MNTGDIRKMLLKQIDDVISKKATIDEARVVCDLTSQLIYSQRLELESKRINVDIAKMDEEKHKYMGKDFSKLPKLEI